MSWARYDDELSMNRKVGQLRALGIHGIAALGLHLLANTYCRHNGTKGHVDEHVPELLIGRSGRKLAHILTQVGMFDEEVSGGWQIHDYAEFHDPSDPDPDRSAADRKRELSEIRRKAGSKGGQQTAQQNRSNAGSKQGDLLPANGVAKEQQSRSPDPVPVPSEQVRDTSTPVDTPGRGGGDLNRINQVADNYARIALQQANGINNRDAYTRTARKTALDHPDIGRYLERWPTAPADAIAAWLHGDKHSMAYYPDTTDNAATIHQLHRGEANQ